MYIDKSSIICFFYYVLSTHADRQGADISVTVCLFVCVFVRLRISPPRINLAASNFARRFIGVQGRESHIWWNVAAFAPSEAQNRTNRPARGPPPRRSQQLTFGSRTHYSDYRHVWIYLFVFCAVQIYVHTTELDRSLPSCFLKSVRLSTAVCSVGPGCMLYACRLFSLLFVRFYEVWFSDVTDAIV